MTLNADFSKRLNKRHRLFYGAEFVWNGVASEAFNEQIISGAQSPESTRYPDGGTKVQTYAGYLKHQFKISDKISLSESLRYSHYNLDSRFDNSTFFDFPFDEIGVNAGAFSREPGPGLQTRPSWQLNAMAASGFRAPNLDDIAKVFDSSPGNVIVPNDDLQPEFAYSAEASISKNFNESLRISVLGWHTWMVDAIVRDDFLFNGQDSILYQVN